jgi:hypothetical protein
MKLMLFSLALLADLARSRLRTSCAASAYIINNLYTAVARHAYADILTAANNFEFVNNYTVYNAAAANIHHDLYPAPAANADADLANDAVAAVSVNTLVIAATIDIISANPDNC